MPYTEYDFQKYGFLKCTDILDHLALDKAEEKLIDEKIFFEKNVTKAKTYGNNLSEEQELVTSGNVRTSTKGSRVFWEILASSKKLRNVLSTILHSDNLYMHMYPTPRIIYNSESGALVPPHFDELYNSHLKNFVTVWVPIDAFNEDQGGLTVWPLSHHNTVKPESVNKEGNWLEPLKTEQFEKVELKCKKGDCIIMSSKLIHASRQNNTDTPRLSLDMRFFGSKNHTNKYYLDCQSWEVFPPDEVVK
jgi:ectoine hydroxylase-related dioxygenase (phytanoyl-CoA dioxygenase family)